MTTDLTKERPDEIERGCEGMTPGPYVSGELGTSLTDDTIFYVRSERSDPIAAVSGSPDIALVGAGRETAQHIARLDPDTVRALVSMARRAMPISRQTLDHAVAAATDHITFDGPNYLGDVCDAVVAALTACGIAIEKEPT